MKKLTVLLSATLIGVLCLTGCGKKEEKQKMAILVVSFGTSYNDSRDVTIGAIENAISKESPEYEVRRAFTSQIIIDKLK